MQPQLMILADLPTFSQAVHTVSMVCAGAQGLFFIGISLWFWLDSVRAARAERAEIEREAREHAQENERGGGGSHAA